MSRALALLLLASCSPNEEASPAPAATDLHAPRGTEAVHCSGASIDPPDAEMEPLAALIAHDRDSAVPRMEALAGSHPGSATVRVRLAEALLMNPPEAERAGRWADLALALHEQRCTLGDEDLWLAWECASLSRFLRHDYAGALPFVRRSVQRFPGATETRYNLACALCQTGDVEGCARELERALAQADDPPPTVLAHRPHAPREHFLQIAESDSDLEPLRANRARFDAILAPYR